MPKNIRGKPSGGSGTKAKADALALAQLIYDVFKESKASGNIDSGQNNAQQTPNS